MLRRAIVLAGSILSAAASADAQVIRGRLLADSTLVPVTLARVDLMQVTGAVLLTVVSDSAGRFTFTVPAAGGYQLRAERIGYARVKSPVVNVGEKDTLHVVLRVGETAILLPALEVTATSAGWNPSAARDIVEFEDRVRRGLGRFMLPDQIRRLNPFRATDLLNEFSGVRVDRRGANVGVLMSTDFGGWCTPTFFVDGQRTPGAPLDELVSGGAVRAIEVYRRRVLIPGRFIVRDNDCGAIVIWTNFKFGDFVK